MSAVLKEQSQDMSIVLHVDESLQRQIAQSEGALAVAEAFVIDSPEMAQLAADERRDLARRIDALKEARKKFIAPAQEIIENAKALFGPGIAALEAARERIGASLLGWSRQEEARIAAEQAAREEQARKDRQAAAEAAAAAIARADAEAAAERRKAEEAEAKRKQAEADGNARAAKAAAAEVARANERANAAVENGNAVATEKMVNAVAAAPVAAQRVKIAGSSVRENWVAELKPGVTEEQAKALIVAGCATNPQLLGLLELDTSAINKMAKALKKAMDVPGYVAVDRPQLAGSRK